MTARHKLLLCCFLLAIFPPFLYCKLFCRQDGGIASRCTECCYSHNHLKSTTAFCPHQPSPNRTIPRLALNLPALSKGGGLTVRHKLLLCCFVLAICPPFLYCKLFCRQDGGIASVAPNTAIPTTFSKALPSFAHINPSKTALALTSH